MFVTLHHWFLVFLVETCVWFVFCFLILYISVYSPVHKWMNIQRKQCEIKIANTKEGRRSHRKRTIDRARADTQFRFWSKFSVTIFFRFSVLDSLLFYKKVEYCLNISFKNILCGWTTKKKAKTGRSFQNYILLLQDVCTVVCAFCPLRCGSKLKCCESVCLFLVIFEAKHHSERGVGDKQWTTRAHLVCLSWHTRGLCQCRNLSLSLEITALA